MPLGVFLPLAVKVATAVADIHGRGLIHKDLKPNNILFDPETDEVKIADFCTASRIAREQTSARPAQLIEGSLPYVSPEQTGRMNRAVDSRSDLYSLGVTFYQLAHRPPAFRGQRRHRLGALPRGPDAHPAGRAAPDAAPCGLRHRPQAARQGTRRALPERRRPRVRFAALPDAVARHRAYRAVPARRARRVRSFSHSAEALRPGRGVRLLARRVRARGRQRGAGALAGLGLLRRRQVVAGARAAPSDRRRARPLRGGEVRAVQARHPLLHHQSRRSAR